MADNTQGQQNQGPVQKKKFLTTRYIVILGVIGIVFAVLFAIFYYAVLSGRGSLTGLKDGEEVSQDTMARGESYTVDFEEIDNSKQSGWATITDIKDKTSVLIELGAVFTTDPQPAAIYNGSCPEPGDSVAYELEEVLEGTSETILDDSLSEIRTKLPLSIVLFKSSIEPTTPVACTKLK